MKIKNKLGAVLPLVLLSSTALAFDEVSNLGGTDSNQTENSISLEPGSIFYWAFDDQLKYLSISRSFYNQSNLLSLTEYAANGEDTYETDSLGDVEGAAFTPFKTTGAIRSCNISNILVTASSSSSLTLVFKRTLNLGMVRSGSICPDQEYKFSRF